MISEQRKKKKYRNIYRKDYRKTINERRKLK